MQRICFPSAISPTDELGPSLKHALGADLEESEIAYLLERQSNGGNLHPSLGTAKRNGGDFDFDTVCIMPSDQFPRFVAGRIAYGEQCRQQKTKLTKAKSPGGTSAGRHEGAWNRIGSITDLKTSCLAAGRPDLAYKLVEQLQNALDSLKHRVEIDESVISESARSSSGALAQVQARAQSGRICRLTWM